MQRSTKPPEIHQAFLCSRKWNSHPIEQVDDLRSHIAHSLNRGLVRQKVAAVHRIVEMLRRRVAFAFGVDRAINAALCTHRVRAFYRHDRYEIDSVTRFGYLHRGGEPCKPAAYDGDF